MGNSTSRQYTYHQYYNVIKNDKSFDFRKINYDLLDPYEVLEVRKNYTWDELKDAYKYTALITHPDKPGGNEIVFNFVTECFKKLAYEYKARQSDKTFIDLKKQVEDYYSKDEENSKNRPPPVIDENFNERFNRSCEMCRLENEEFDFGYGDMMEQSTKKREDFKNENLFEKQKFDNKSFNSIFNKHVPAPSKEVVKYKEPEPMVLANKMSYTEIGGKRPDDYSSSIEKEGKNNLVYTFEIIEKSEEEINYVKWLKVRELRNKLLSESDLNVVSDKWHSYTDKEKNAWINYRQILRNIPQQFMNPDNIAWPEKPGVNNNVITTNLI